MRDMWSTATTSNATVAKPLASVGWKFLLRTAAGRYNLTDPQQLAKFLDEALPVVAELKKDTEREAYIPLLEGMTGLTRARLRAFLTPAAGTGGNADKGRENTGAGSNPRVGGRENASTAAKPNAAKPGLTNAHRAARFAVYCLFADKYGARNIADIQLMLANPAHTKLYDLYRAGISIEELTERLESIEPEAVTDFDRELKAVIEHRAFEFSEKYFSDCVATLKKAASDARRKELSAEYDNCLDDARRKEILIELHTINTNN